jgi:hypothetical protein
VRPLLASAADASLNGNSIAAGLNREGGRDDAERGIGGGQRPVRELDGGEPTYLIYKSKIRGPKENPTSEGPVWNIGKWTA